MIRPTTMLALGMLLQCLAWHPSHAYETDPFTNRLHPLQDSTAALNRQVNEALVQIVADWQGCRSEKKMVKAVYKKLGGFFWVDRIEKWAMRSPEVDKLATPRFRSIYAGHPLWATRVTALFGVGSTFKVDGSLIGSDKLGHFFSQGRKFYRRWLRMGSEPLAARHSAFTERAIFGAMMTGDYSNADLVSNYEGHRFYRSLFEDGIVEGKPAILRRENSRWIIQRFFDWADHVNPYWDEAIAINRFDRLLYPYMKKRLKDFCADYARAPDVYSISAEAEQALQQRYSFLQLKDSRELRLDRLCR